MNLKNEFNITFCVKRETAASAAVTKTFKIVCAIKRKELQRRYREHQSELQLYCDECLTTMINKLVAATYENVRATVKSVYNPTAEQLAHVQRRLAAEVSDSWLETKIIEYELDQRANQQSQMAA
jgi:hypothetical protein